jgi:site-specific DNA-methyltransferase (adenine-specific)
MNEIIQGDCLEVMKQIPDGSVDMVMTDPPYGTTACKWDSIIPLEPMWEQLKRIIKPNGAIVMTASQPFSSVLTCSNLDMFKHEWIWIKNRGSNFANTVREPMKEHEVVLVFSRGKWVYNKQMQLRTGSGLDRVKYDFNSVTESENYHKFERASESKGKELRVPSSWQKFNTACGKEKVGHPTQKPVALMEYLIKTYTNEGETVLDFTCGSGTTCVACVNTKRNYIGIEMDEKYHAIAVKRVQEAKDSMGLFKENEHLAN